MEKKYYIKEFSETFGVSTATLRYYEKIGLVCSKRDPNNLYRYYTDDDCHKIMLTRMLRSFGFSLNDIKENRWIKNSKNMIESLNSEIQRIDLQMQMLTLKKNQLEYYRKITGYINDKRFFLGKERLGKKFLFYCQMIKDEMVRPGDPYGITYELYESMPLCMAGTLIDGISDGSMVQKYGLLIQEEYLPESVSVTHMDERVEVNDCLHLIIPVTDGSVAFSIASFDTIGKYAASQGYPNSEKAVCTIIPSSEKETDSYLDCYVLI